MKKTLLVSMAVMLTVGLGQMSAQSNVSWGVKAGANLSNFIRSDLGHLDNPMRIGAQLGGFMKWDITENFAIQPEVLFNFHASKFENTRTDEDNSYEYWGMEIPVYAVGQMQLGSGRGYVGLGPYVGVGFSAKSFPGKTDLYDKKVLQRWDFGLGAMVGYEFRNGVAINAGYQIGFIDALDAGKDDATMLPQAITLGMAYRF